MPVHDWSVVDAGVFHDFHLGWIAALRSDLNDRLLPEPYYAIAEPVTGSVIPDVLTLKSEAAVAGSPAVAQGLSPDDSPGGAVAVAPSSVVVQDLGPVYWRLARRIAIRDSLREDRLVAVIEIVSQGNKDARARVEQFVAKSLGFIDAGVHLLIIDLQSPTNLVPRGFHALVCESLGHEAPLFPEGRDRQTVSYQVIESGFPRSHLVPVGIGDPLPEMPVFLLPHHFVRVPLEPAYGAAFRSLGRRFREALQGKRG